MTLYLPVRRGFSFWPFIVIPRKDRGAPRDLLVYIHEKVHYDRQAWWSPIWVVLYFLSASFRWREESKAFAAEIAANPNANVNQYADALSTQYWGMIDYATARLWVRTQIALKGERR